MSNVEKGRFYWLKLKEDFFEDDAIEWLEEQKNGKEYALFYLKLCLKSLKSNGTLIRRVGTMLVPYDTEKLAEITRSDFDTVVVAMELLKKIGLIEVLDSGAIYIASLADMVGSEAKSTSRSRLCRERKRLSQSNERQKALQCNTDETPVQQNCNREIEIEKEIEIEIEKERDNESATPILNTPAQKTKRKNAMLTDEEYEKLVAAMPELLEQEAEPEKEPDKEPEPKKSKPKKHQYGEYKNVLLTDEEYRKLTETYPDYGERIERLSGYIASTGKAYKSHYATIRNWAKRDGEQATGYAVRDNGRQYKGVEIVTVNGKQYEKRSDGKYYVPGGNGIAVNPYERDTDSLF